LALSLALVAAGVEHTPRELVRLMAGVAARGAVVDTPPPEARILADQPIYQSTATLAAMAHPLPQTTIQAVVVVALALLALMEPLVLRVMVGLEWLQSLRVPALPTLAVVVALVSTDLAAVD